MGLTNKTDTLDAKGLAILLRNGSLPDVWIPPSELRDQRELLRLRIFPGEVAHAGEESHPRYAGALQRAGTRQWLRSCELQGSGPSSPPADWEP
jgi:hypothetical protein